jgi:hypothetical protein
LALATPTARNWRANGSAREYWADLRPLRSMTLEEIVKQQRIEQIDLLKLDCEGSEFSILGNTTLLDRINMVVGEYHGRESFLKLVSERFADWDLQILKDGELGTFWLTRKRALAARPPAAIPAHVGRGDHESARPVAFRLIVSALRSEPRVASDLLLMDNGTVISRLELGETQIRGFARLDGITWAVDSRGGLHHVSIRSNELRLAEISRSALAREAHDLAVMGRTLVTASPANNLIACFDTQAGLWSAQRPWLSTAENTESAAAEFTDLYHLNCAVPDGEKFLLSLFARDAKPASARWRDMDLAGGVIARWGRDGFHVGLAAEGIYGPHSIRLHDGYVWWCDAFRGQVARSDGWRSEPLRGFARGLRLVDGRCLVGLSMSRVGDHPHLDFCGIAVVDATTGAQLDRVALPAPYTEVYSLWPLTSPDD